ncbi:hypothetical protein PCANC_26440 [Puccinia coronata f. sp. avenae]|uniref:Uncharacterized protein n=1 Tax=Puccinia coronata f. sp. avenae TaxID=200324 RepID=A0A2N5TG33_9BASI|nr:hypothetical protein PCANC_26440 [Puccinia coronata f. sp. avenae]
MPKRAHENYAFPPPRLQRERERAGDTGYSPELSPLGAMIAAACLKCTFVKMIRSCKNVYCYDPSSTQHKSRGILGRSDKLCVAGLIGENLLKEKV